MPAKLRGALLPLPLLLLAACGGGSPTSAPSPTANDPKPTTSGTTADFDPSTGNIPLPNVLLTATTTSVTYTASPAPTAGALNVNPGYPLTPDKAVNFLNLQEAGGTSAVSGLNAPIYLSFSGAVDPATVNASTVKVFQVLPDVPSSATSLENSTLGFHDVSAQFTYQVLASGKEVYAMPQVPLLPGARYLYVVTNGVHDPSGVGIGASLVFGIEKYVKAGGTSYATDTTNLGDLTDSGNPAAVLGQSTATQLESIAANVTSSGQIVLSGFRKAMWDLIANGSADVSGKTAAGAGATGITSRAQIAVLGRFITTSTGATKPDPVGNPSSLIPVETALWGWANHADLSAGIPGANFSTAESRVWSNTVSNFQVIGTSAIPDSGSPDTETSGSLGYIFRTPNPANPPHLMYIPHAAVGLVAWGSFEGANLPMDPYVTQQNLASAGGDLDAATPATSVITGQPMGGYNPGTSAIPGTGTLIGFRNGTGVLRGYYHTTRTVPFVIIAPAAAPVGGTYPVMIFMHGIGRSKEDVLALANTACASGYAVIAIDQAVHGYPAGASGSLTATGVATGMGNGRPQAEWASNFFMLPSSLTARANIYQSAFNLMRLERVLKQPTADPNSLQTAMTGAGKPLAVGGATQYVGQSLGSIVGSVFLAGNSGQTGGSNMKALLSVPGGRLAWVLHDSPAFKATVDAGLAANGVATGSPAYNKFFLLAQTVADSADPASMALPILAGQPSRLAGRILVQEAVGDAVIPNTNGRYFVNALAGRKPQLGADISLTASGAFTQVAPGATPAVPYVFGGGLGDWATIKTAVVPAIGAATTPIQGVFQYGTTATPATHGLLLDGSANTPAAQTQMARWLAVNLVTDGSAAYPIAPPPPSAELFGPENLQIAYPR